MARDRLAGLRAQQGGYQPEHSYPSADRYGDGGRGYSGTNDGYGNQGRYDDSHEMSTYGNAGGDDMSAFYSEISAIQDQIRVFNDNVNRISELHSRSLNNMDEVAMQRTEAQLDALVEDTRTLSGNLKRRIQDLERRGGAGRDGQIRKQQSGLVKSKFVEAIQNYQEVEKQYRAKYKARLERQYKIVNPNATPDEVQAVVNNEGDGQIFAQALMNSQRYGQSKAAYNEVQERHKDIMKIEQTITELAQLFNDMSVLVEQQDETLNVIEAHAAQVNVDTEAGLKHTEAAVDSAKAARKKRWICFWICVIIAIIIAIVVAVVVTQHINTNKNS
ncbi:Plasma membrane t-SNARE, secretory vesicle fusion [Tulasnella sp. 427]|nr:Plasma membrane t-SNARE, secretory vesicle fusion [Tulasnella sp. 427]